MWDTSETYFLVIISIIVIIIINYFAPGQTQKLKVSWFCALEKIISMESDYFPLLSVQPDSFKWWLMIVWLERERL